MLKLDPFSLFFDSSRECDNLITAFNKAEEGANGGDIRTMEVYSNEALRTLDNIRKQLLSIRVKGYLQHGKFRKAQAVAETIQKTVSYEKGSAQLFHILMAEKRYWDVIELYNTFESRKGNERSPRYGFQLYGIEELRQQAMEKLEKYHRIDLMEKLPQETITLILDQLDFHDIVNCLQVSKSWRHHICNGSAMSRQHVILDYEEREKNGSFSTEFYKSSVRLLSDGIKSLKISGYSEKLQTEVLDTLTGATFNGLRVFSIEDAARFSHEQLKNLLQGFRNSLEEIDIQYSVLTFNEILDICPNIKRLHYKVFQMPPQQQSQPQPHYPSLTYLYIDIGSLSRREEFKQVLERAINLQEITIVDKNVSADTLRLINQFGSRQLRHICINEPSDSYNTSFDSDEYSDTIIDTSRFNCVVDVHNCRHLTATLLLSLLNRNIDIKHKLSAISFSLPEKSLMQNWSSFKHFTSPCLRLMRFSFTRETEDVFATVIRNCPTLEEVSIFRLLAPPSNITMDALKTLPTLKCFAIENVESEVFDHGLGNLFVPECITYVDDISIRQFFTYHVLLDNHSTLQEVRLRHISDMEPATFETLFKIKSLKTVNFAGLDLLSTNHDFGSVISNEKGGLLPAQLESLVLEGVRDINDYDLQFLDFPTLMLVTMDCWTVAGIKGMIKNAKKLKTLMLCDCREHTTEAEIKDFATKYNIQVKVPGDYHSFTPIGWTMLN